MPSQIVIGIAGYGGAGKSTTSDWFLQNHGFKRVSFADPIRAMLMALGVPEATLRDPVKKLQPCELLLGRTPVYAMETLGTGWGRDKMHPHFWVGQLAAQTRRMPFVIVDDVRFQNEVEAIHEMGGKVWRLTRPGLEPTRDTDFKVRALTDVIDLVNDPHVNTTKDIYKQIYSAAMGG